MSITQADLDAIHGLVQPLIGMAPWDVSLSLGSFVTFEFGEWRLGSGGYVHGEWNLWIQMGSWLMETPDEFLAASNDPRAERAVVVKRMQGVRINAFEVSAPALDTVITFENGLRLRVFPFYSEDRDHWLLFTPNGYVLVIDGTTWSYHNASEPHP